MSLSSSRHTLSRLAAAGVTASLLVAGVAAQAQAASFPHVSQAKAKAALPTSKSLPGGVKLQGKVEVAGRTFGQLCTTKPASKVSLPGGGVVIATYANKASALSDSFQEYDVSVVTFATAAEATSGAARLAKAEKACPKAGHAGQDQVSFTVARTLSTKTSVKGWTGYRTIDHLNATVAGSTISFRGYETFLMRGNVIVVIDQLGSGSSTSSKVQEARRKTVTNLVIHRLSALK